MDRTNGRHVKSLLSIRSRTKEFITRVLKLEWFIFARCSLSDKWCWWHYDVDYMTKFRYCLFCQRYKGHHNHLSEMINTVIKKNEFSPIVSNVYLVRQALQTLPTKAWTWGTLKFLIRSPNKEFFKKISKKTSIQSDI